MKTSALLLFALVCVLASTATAAVRYVDINCATPTPPYMDWATAATNIQDAVNVATNRDEIIVADGVYATGGTNYGGMTNRVLLLKTITLRSVNGPAKTIIEGAQPGGSNGPAAIRCVYMSPYAVVSGFTLTNGATTTNLNYGRGGGVYCSSTDGVVTNCVLVGNTAWERGGGGYMTWLQNCLVLSNSAPSGGGLYGSMADNCTFKGNLADSGGGAYEVFLSNSVLNDNWAKSGGGAAGGGVFFCTITGNAAKNGGGVNASPSGSNPQVYNSIIWYNNALREGDNWNAGYFINCYTTPMPTNTGVNFAFDPQLASLSHLSSSSPCRGASSQVKPILTDIDGEAWLKPASIGCDEYNTGSVTGALAVAVSAPFTNFASGFSAGFRALIDGRTVASVWNFGDGVTLSNRPCANHAWANPGTYEVVLTAYNESFPEGVSERITIHVYEPAIHYVDVAGTNPVPPFTSWDRAATDIQSAIDAALPGESVVVADGVYASGGRAVTTITTNRVVVDRPLTVRSLNGPARTVIVGSQAPGGGAGDGAIRCVWLTNDSIFSGFTLTNGATRKSGGDLQFDCGGGGAFCASRTATLNNCVLVGNMAVAGGGVCGGTLNSCALVRNSVSQTGAGTYVSLLHNCTVVSHSGQAVAFGAVNNCIIYSNSTALWLAVATNCCLSTLPALGAGNFSSPPLFVDLANLDLRLQSNSPCINAGRNSLVYWSTDLDGNPRISGGTVDVGAYEYQSPASSVSYVWLQRWGLPCDGSADQEDCDGDGMNAWQEWIADTAPTNSASLLRLLTPAVNPPAATVTWTSSTNRSYFVERATALSPSATFTPIAGNLPGRANTTSFVDTNAPLSGSAVYRVGVQIP